MSTGHPPQNGSDRFIGVGAIELLRNIFEMVDEGERVSLADLALEGKKKCQHQFRAESHGCADITNDHDLWLAGSIAIFDFHRHALILEIASDGRLRIELSTLGTFLSQRNSSFQSS